MNGGFEVFQVVGDRGRQLTRLNADVVFYFDPPLSAFTDSVVAAMKTFYELWPQKQLAWYATETMKQFRPATRQSYTLPSVWWQDAAPQKPLRELFLKGGDAHESTATSGVFLSSAEPTNRISKKQANYLRFIVPAQFFAAEYRRFEEFVLSLCGRLPFVSGHGGYVIETNMYYAEQAQGAAYPLAMRYHAVDIATLSRAPWAVRGERIKNVAWLTLVGTELLDKLGGFGALKAGATERLKLTETPNGAVIRAGDAPILGDVNRRESLMAYVDAYRLVKPLHEGIATLFAPFSLPGDQDEVAATERWLFRFAQKAG